jgi:hypothetical protein
MLGPSQQHDAECRQTEGGLLQIQYTVITGPCPAAYLERFLHSKKQEVAARQ